VNDGVATTGELDESIIYGPGLRWAAMGTNLIYHLAGGESGRFKLPFPTMRNLIRLGKQASVNAALDDSRGKNVVTVMPVMTRLNGGRQLRIPLEAGYDGELFEVGAV